jgi:SET domain-containing protein
VVYPKSYASLGFFMNHSSQKSNKVNVSTMIALCQNGPIILMLANRKIKKGEETLYNYNGVLDSYDTEAYE